MSQHYFSTQLRGEAITVLLGWDRRLQYHFMVVERDEPARDQSDYLYVNLDDANVFELDLPFFRQKLVELGLQVPESMFEQVEHDRLADVGNRVVTHLADGTFSG